MTKINFFVESKNGEHASKDEQDQAETNIHQMSDDESDDSDDEEYFSNVERPKVTPQKSNPNAWFKPAAVAVVAVTGAHVLAQSFKK